MTDYLTECLRHGKRGPGHASYLEVRALSGHILYDGVFAVLLRLELPGCTGEDRRRG